MTKYGWRKSSRQQALVLLTCIGLTSYFAYHAISGKHGLKARSRLLSRSAVLDRQIKGLETVRARLEREIALLSKPDPDYISELAARLLGYRAATDIVITDAASSSNDAR